MESTRKAFFVFKKGDGNLNWAEGVKCKDTNEVCYSYKDYLNSKHWIKFRVNFLKKVTNKCRMCQTTQGVNLHHKHYNSLGNEKNNDIVCLCFKCHKYIHVNSSTLDTRHLFEYKNPEDKKNKIKKVKTKKPKK